MTQYAPGEELIRRGGIGGQAQRPAPSNPGGVRGQQGGSVGGRGSGGGGRPGGGGPGGGGAARDPGDGGGQSGPRLPDDYLKDGYFDAKGNIHERLIVADAIDIARKLEAERMTRSQLRSFYNEVADVKHLLRLQGSSFEALKPRVLKLRGFAHNATTRRTNKVPQLFYDFITKNTELAGGDQTGKSFLAGFCEHFECVVLYFRGR